MALPRLYGPVGPGIKALASVQYFACNVAEPKILEIFANVGIQLSAGELSNWLIKDWPDLHAEKAAIHGSRAAKQPVATPGRDGHVGQWPKRALSCACNPLYTAYFTTARKDRLTIVDVLRNLGARTFRVNAEAIDLLRIFGLAQCTVRHVQGLPQDQDLPEAEFTALLDARLPTLGPQQRARILEAAAVAAYHAQLEFPVIKLLLCDDAPQFNWVTEQLALCWIHEGRHYKKLDPSSAPFRTALTEFTKQFWEYYDELLAYRQQPNAAEKARLTANFDTLFATVTAIGPWMSASKRPGSRRPACCWSSTIPKSRCITTPPNWAPASACANAMSAWPAYAGRRQSLGYLHDPDRHGQEAGRQIYHYIHDRVRRLRDAGLADTITQRLPPNCHWAHPGNRHNRFPRIIEKILLILMNPGNHATWIMSMQTFSRGTYLLLRHA